MRIRLDISYDGTYYQGWQKQAHTSDTIQEKLEGALKKLFDQEVTTIGSGRTDSGVHANQQSVHFDLSDDIDIEKYKILSALNSMLPRDISADRVYLVKQDFHALGSATEKHYVYRMYLSKYPKALLDRFSLQVYQNFSREKWEDYFQELIGKHDFKSFQTAGTPVPNTIRNIRELQIIEENGLVEVHIKGDGFLKQMVRNLVGTLLDLNKVDAPNSKLKEILEAKDRTKAGKTAPAKGLFLMQVSYPEDLIIKSL